MNENDAFSMDFDGARSLAFNTGDCPLLDPPRIRIYAAGPLTNIGEDTSFDCTTVRGILKRVFAAYDYQGIRFDVYDPGDVTQPGSQHTAEEVYELNYEQSVLADLVVFHVNVPSLGVGCEAQISADATVPRVTLAKADIPVSRMFEGMFSATIATLEYVNHADLELQLFRQLPELAARVIRSAQRRRPVLAGFSALQLGTVILKQRIVHNVTVERLADEADITSSWLRKIETNHMLAACCTAIQLNRIAAATHCYVKTVDPRNLTTLAPSDSDLSRDEQQSLDNLVAYIGTRDYKLGDDRVFRLWNSYRVDSARTASEAVAFRAGENNAVTADEWRRRDGRPHLF